MQKKLFVVEDEPDMQEFYKEFLEKENYSIECFSSGELALNRLDKEIPDLILLDLMLPGMSGFEFCQKMKSESKYSNINVIILSARNDEFDIITGINIGCDDYITKPFNPKILLAKIKSILGRKEKLLTSDTEVLKYKTITMDSSKFEIYIDGNKVNMTPGEFKLLYFLMKSMGRVYSRSQIGENISNQIDFDSDRSIDILVGRIRKKIGQYGKNLETIYGVGYTFKED